MVCFLLVLATLTRKNNCRLSSSCVPLHQTSSGSDLEIKYSLLSFGIQGDTLFRCFQEEYIQNRREIEKMEAERHAREQATVGRYSISRRNCCAGRPWSALSCDFPGNKRVGSLVEERLEEYRFSDRFEKSCILIGILNKVHKYKGRFLQKTANGWAIVFRQ
jgi:hypothetical protein